MIELLVVVAIIAILAALLLPALKGAREQARQAACISNLRQTSIILEAYRGDYDGNWAPAWPGTHYPQAYYANRCQYAAYAGVNWGQVTDGNWCRSLPSIWNQGSEGASLGFFQRLGYCNSFKVLGCTKRYVNSNCDSDSSEVTSIPP